MKTKIQLIIVTLLLILSLTTSNSGLLASTSNQDPTPRSIPTPNEPIAGEDFKWGTIEMISEMVPGTNLNINDSQYARVAAEGDKIYVVWDDWTDIDNNVGPIPDSDIFYRHFDGLQWSDIEVISEPIEGANTNIKISREPDIAVDNGKVYVVWHDYNDTNGCGNDTTDTDIFYRTNLTGNGWEDVQVISEPVPGQNFDTKHSFYPAIFVENGNVHVVWRSNNETNGAGPDYDIFYRYNLSGSEWSDFQIVSEPTLGLNINKGASSRPDIAVENDNIYVVWEDPYTTDGSGTDYDIQFRCNLSGAGWQGIQVLSEEVPGQNHNTKMSMTPSIAVENGNIYVVWYDENGTDNSGPEFDVYYLCNLTGTHWEELQIISEPVPGQNYCNQQDALPEIVVDNGRIIVVWESENDTNGCGLDWDIVFRTNLTGTGWSDFQVLSEPVVGNDINVEDCWRPEIAIADGKIHVVWQDMNDTYGAGTDWDIAYRGLTFSLILSSPMVTPLTGNSSQVFNFTVEYSQIYNEPPTTMSVNVSSIEYPMLEVDPLDINYQDGKDYYFNLGNFDIGTHPYYFFAADINYTYSTPILRNLVVYNTAPNITTANNETALEDIYYQVGYFYDDIDEGNVGQVLTWNFSTNATWLGFNLTTAILNGTPDNDDVGIYWVNISINDTFDIDYTNFTITVLNVNDAPVITTSDVNIATEDELYEVDYEATDIDSPQSPLIWDMETNASWLGFELLTGLLYGTPLNDDVGEYWVEITVNDTIDFDDTNFILTVLNVNDRPEITTIDVHTTMMDTLYEVDYNATDIDSPLAQQSWTLTTNATWLAIGPSTGILSGTPTISDVGWYNVNITVDDGDGGEDWREFVLTVFLGNLPPQIITDDVTSATVDELYVVDYDATDANTPLDKLVWTLETNASWLIIEKNLGILTGTPKLSDIGWYWVNVTVTDDEGAFDFHNFNLYVYLTSNQPPEITTGALAIAEVGKKYLNDYNATDDRTPVANLRWYLNTNATWLSINLYNGELSGTPFINDIGIYWVEVSVFDTEDGWDRQNFTLRVFSEPQPEDIIKLTNPTFTPPEGTTETEFTFTIHYYHLQTQDPLYVQLIIDGVLNNMTLVPGESPANGTYTVTLKLPEGVHIYYFVASDGTNIVVFEDYPTPYITKVGGKDTDDKASQDWLAWVVIVIIVIIIVIILLFILLKKKQPKEEPEKAPPSAEAPAVVQPPPQPMPVPPSIQAPTIAAPPPQPVPVPKLAPPTAAVTPQVVPKVVQAPTLADEELAEE